jgi:hypothetical protein
MDKIVNPGAATIKELAKIASSGYLITHCSVIYEMHFQLEPNVKNYNSYQKASMLKSSHCCSTGQV